MKEIIWRGFVISRRNLGDSDRIINAFTYESGKISFIAKGIRKPTAKLQPHIEPLLEKRFSIIGNSKLPVLVGAKDLNSKTIAQLSITSNIFAMYLTEILDIISPPDMQNTRLYDTYKESIAGLSQVKSVLLATNIAIVDMLRSVGIEPRIEKSPRNYYFDYSSGVVGPKKSGQNGSTLNPKIAKLWHVLMTNNKIDRNKLIVHKKYLLESLNILNGYIQYHFDKKIKSSRVIFETWDVLQTD